MQRPCRQPGGEEIGGTNVFHPRSQGVKVQHQGWVSDEIFCDPDSDIPISNIRASNFWLKIPGYRDLRIPKLKKNRI